VKGCRCSATAIRVACVSLFLKVVFIKPLERCHMRENGFFLCEWNRVGLKTISHLSLNVGYPATIALDSGHHLCSFKTGVFPPGNLIYLRH
jgi:hypothetical protein